MKQDASDNYAMPAHILVSYPDAINRVNSTGQAGSPSRGNGTVRKLLYEAANSILTRNRETFALKTWAMKIAKRRVLKKARVALARRLAVIMHAMLRDGPLFQA